VTIPRRGSSGWRRGRCWRRWDRDGGDRAARVDLDEGIHLRRVTVPEDRRLQDEPGASAAVQAAGGSAAARVNPRLPLESERGRMRTRSSSATSSWTQPGDADQILRPGAFPLCCSRCCWSGDGGVDAAALRTAVALGRCPVRHRPQLIAHGRYVTNDLMVTFFTFVT